jgi:hypothetical protein
MTLTPTTIRNDLKCGKGAISEGEKCTKGPAQKVQPKKPTKFRNSRAKKAMDPRGLTGKLVAGAVIGGATLLRAGLEVRSQRRTQAQAALKDLKQTKRNANTVFATQLGVIAEANKRSPNNPRLQQASFRAAMQAKGYRDLKRAAVRKGLSQLKAQVPKSAARRRAARRKSDSVYAQGFNVDYSGVNL